MHLETTLNNESAAATAATAAIAVGGQGQDEQELDWESTLEPWADRVSFNSEDAKCKAWNAVFRARR